MFSKLYDSITLSTMSRWTKEYKCINAVQNRACRFFLGVGKYAPNNAVNGDIGWIPFGQTMDLCCKNLLPLKEYARRENN